MVPCVPVLLYVTPLDQNIPLVVDTLLKKAGPVTVSRLILALPVTLILPAFTLAVVVILLDIPLDNNAVTLALLYIEPKPTVLILVIRPSAPTVITGTSKLSP